MLSPSEEESVVEQQKEKQQQSIESAVDVGGPRSPPPYDINEAETVDRHNKQHRQKTTGNIRDKLHLANMSTKIQIIPGNRQGQLNTAYITTAPGLMKIAEIVLSGLIFILAIVADRTTTTAAWTEHVAFECCVVVSALLCGYVIFPHLTIKEEATREGLIVLELIFYGINTLLWFVSIWLMIHLSATSSVGRGAGILAAIVTVFITILFAIETFHKIKAWRAETGSTTIINNSTSGGGATNINVRNGSHDMP